MTETVSLPEGFEALEPYAKVWGKLEDQAQRYLQRQHSSMKEPKAYYDSVAPRLNEIFDHLDKFPMNDLPEQEALLSRTELGLTEAAMAMELFKPPGVPYAPFHPQLATWGKTEERVVGNTCESTCNS